MTTSRTLDAPGIRQDYCNGGLNGGHGLPPLGPGTRALIANGNVDEAGVAPEADPDLDARRFRSVLGLFATGVIAVTAIDRASGRPVGVTANSFTSVSLNPPLVSFCMAHTSSTWPRIRASRDCCINILAEDQQQICVRLATSGSDKFSDVTWTASLAGHPIIEGVLGWLECAIEVEHQAGDHVIVICRVLRLDMLADGHPLLFYRGNYGRFERSPR